MSDKVLQQKIESLRNCLERIESKRPFDAEELSKNFDLQDIISINLERAVQASVDIATYLLSKESGKSPTTMAESFVFLSDLGRISKETAQDLIKSVGLRNLLVHEYSKINWEIVAKVAMEHLGSFKNFMNDVLKIKK